MGMTGLPVERGFRQRGQQVSRMETFVDAAFAFSLTLLVIVQDDLPQTVAELRGALRRVPTFVACFALLAMFWAAHNRWSRRFGLADPKSVLLSLAFVLVVLVYVYPLRMVVSSGLAMMTGGWVPSELGQPGERWLLDVQTVFIVYSVGFGLLAWLLWRLNAHAMRHADALALDPAERFDAGSEIGLHRIMTGAALASVLLSLLVLMLEPADAVAWLIGLPMWAYAVMGGVLPWYSNRRSRGRACLAEST